MRHYIFLFALLLSTPFLIQAQESSADTKKDSLIKMNIVKNGRYSSVVYTLNNEVLTNSDIKSILNTYPKSAEELHKYYRQRRTGLIMLPIVIASVAVGSIQANNQKNIPGSQFSKAPIPFSISIGALVSFLIIAGSNNHFHKAIKEYNSQF